MQSIVARSNTQLVGGIEPVIGHNTSDLEQISELLAEDESNGSSLSKFLLGNLPAIQGRGDRGQGASMKRSFSDPCTAESALRSRAKRHSRCLTDVTAGKGSHTRATEGTSLKPVVQAAKPPLRDRRRHKRMQSMDVTNDPTSCKLVATL